jgi:tetratricopeptide (TPR) repeat protein
VPYSKDRIRKPTVYAITGAGVALALVGSYLAFEAVSSALRVRMHMVEPSAREPTRSADIISRPSTEKLRRSSETKDLEGSLKPANAMPSQELAIAPPPPRGGTAATVDVALARDFGVNDARYYRERGILAYRSGDFYLALVHFNLAISLDPNFSDAFIDRSVVYHRLGDLERALADVAAAKRIDDSNRSNAPVTAASR